MQRTDRLSYRQSPVDRQTEDYLEKIRKYRFSSLLFSSLVNEVTSDEENVWVKMKVTFSKSQVHT